MDLYVIYLWIFTYQRKVQYLFWMALNGVIFFPLCLEPESGLEEGEAQVQMGRMMPFLQVSFS